MLLTLAQATPEAFSIGSISAIAGTTTLVVSAFVKPHLSKVKHLKKVPLIAYTIATSATLTFLSHRYFGVMPDAHVGRMMVKAGLSAVAAGGFYKLPSATASVEEVSKPRAKRKLRSWPFLRK